MTFDYTEKLIFCAEWFQQEANMTRTFYVFFFPADNTVEMFDHRTKKTFLKRTKVAGLSEGDFYIGAKLNIFGRQIVVKDYGNPDTKTKLSSKREKAFCLLKPDAIAVMDKILKRFEMDHFKINNCLMVQLKPSDVNRFYVDKQGDAILPMLMEYESSGPMLAIELVSENALQKLLEIVGPENPDEAKRDAPNSLRAKYGEDLVKNIVYCSETIATVQWDMDFFFSKDKSPIMKQPNFTNTSLAIIKPHAVKESKIGEILTAIYDGDFNVTAMRMIYLDRPNCEEFYEVYKGVVPEYVQMVLELADGPCVAFEVAARNAQHNSYSNLRKLCGPVDPDVAKQLRPHTIRAKFGNTKVQNSIHCTDLEEDTQTEIQYFFKLI